MQLNLPKSIFFLTCFIAVAAHAKPVDPSGKGPHEVGYISDNEELSRPGPEDHGRIAPTIGAGNNDRSRRLTILCQRVEHGSPLRPDPSLRELASRANRHRFRVPERQQTEAMIGVNNLDRMTALGMPDSMAVG